MKNSKGSFIFVINGKSHHAKLTEDLYDVIADRIKNNQGYSLEGILVAPGKTDFVICTKGFKDKRM